MGWKSQLRHAPRATRRKASLIIAGVITFLVVTLVIIGGYFVSRSGPVSDDKSSRGGLAELIGDFFRDVKQGTRGSSVATGTIPDMSFSATSTGGTSTEQTVASSARPSTLSGTSSQPIQMNDGKTSTSSP